MTLIRLLQFLAAAIIGSLLGLIFSVFMIMFLIEHGVIQ